MDGMALVTGWLEQLTLAPCPKPDEVPTAA